MSAIYEADGEGFDLTASPPPALHFDHKTAGTDAFKSKDYSTAIAEYTKAYSSAPTSDDGFKAVVLANRSAAHGALKEFSKALEDAKLSIKYDPENVKAYYRAATYSFDMKDYVGTISSAEKGLKLDPENKVRGGRGRCRRR